MSDELRRQLVLLLRGGQAHMGFDEAVADFPASAINDRAPNVTTRRGTSSSICASRRGTS